MRSFSGFVAEARERKNFDSFSLLSAEIDQFVKKVNKSLPKNVQDAIYLTKKYNLLDSKSILDIRDANKSQLSNLSLELNVSVDDLVELQKLLKDLKRSIKLLPQMMSEAERLEIEAGKLSQDDLTIDLESQAGRNAVAKLYTPMVIKIANNYIGKSSLDRAALISAGMLGLANAINDFDREKSNMTFKNYAYSRIQQAILDDINTVSHTMSGTSWYTNKYHAGEADAASLDAMARNDDGDYMDDHLSALASDDADFELDTSTPDHSKAVAELSKTIEAKFNQRDCDIFYSSMGINAYAGKALTGREIAKKYGISGGRVTQTVNKIIDYIKHTPKAMNALRSLLESFEVSLLRDQIYYTDKKVIYENLIASDMFILLEELNRWSNKDMFKATITTATNQLDIAGAKFIFDCIQNGFSFIDANYRKNKSLIVAFLRTIYPTENFSKLSDVSIIEKLVEISDTSKEFNIKW